MCSGSAGGADPVEAARERPEDVGPTELARVLDVVEDSDAPRSQSAAVGLANVATESPGLLVEDLSRVVSLLDVTDGVVRSMVAAALSDVAATEPDAVVDAVPALTRCLDADDPVRRHALAALAYLSRERPAAVADAIPGVVSVLSSDPESPAVRGYAVTVVRECVRAHETPAVVADAVPTLLAFVDGGERAASPVVTTDEESPVAHAHENTVVTETTARNDALAVLVAAARDHPATVAAHADAIAARLAADAAPVRAAMAESLQWLADDAPEAVRPAIKPLADAVSDEDAVAAAAMRALAAVAEHEPAAVADAVVPNRERVTDRLEHEDTDVRAAAASLLAYLAEARPGAVESSVPALVDRLTDDHPAVRGQAIWALGFLRAADALPALAERAREDPDPDIRALADEMAARVREGE